LADSAEEIPTSLVEPDDEALSENGRSPRSPFQRCLNAAAEWIAHTLLITVIISCNSALDWVLRFFLQAKNPHFFGMFPVTYLFQAADVFVIIGLQYHGIKAAVITYGEKG
jgi:hypothetical protein